MKIRHLVSMCIRFKTIKKIFHKLLCIHSYKDAGYNNEWDIVYKCELCPKWYGVLFP